MSACNHATFSQAIIKCVTEVGIKYEQVIAMFQIVLLIARRRSRMFFLILFM